MAAFCNHGSVRCIKHMGWFVFVFFYSDVYKLLSAYTVKIIAAPHTTSHHRGTHFHLCGADAHGLRYFGEDEAQTPRG